MESDRGEDAEGAEEEGQEIVEMTEVASQAAVVDRVAVAGSHGRGDQVVELDEAAELSVGRVIPAHDRDHRPEPETGGEQRAHDHPRRDRLAEDQQEREDPDRNQPADKILLRDVAGQTEQDPERDAAKPGRAHSLDGGDRGEQHRNGEDADVAHGVGPSPDPVRRARQVMD
jgi:hypothetical protein